LRTISDDEFTTAKDSADEQPLPPPRLFGTEGGADYFYPPSYSYNFLRNRRKVYAQSLPAPCAIAASSLRNRRQASAQSSPEKHTYDSIKTYVRFIQFVRTIAEKRTYEFFHSYVRFFEFVVTIFLRRKDGCANFATDATAA
jgi:hypothetical protein